MSEPRTRWMRVYSNLLGVLSAPIMLQHLPWNSAMWRHPKEEKWKLQLVGIQRVRMWGGVRKEEKERCNVNWWPMWGNWGNHFWWRNKTKHHDQQMSTARVLELMNTNWGTVSNTSVEWQMTMSRHNNSMEFWSFRWQSFLQLFLLHVNQPWSAVWLWRNSSI